MGIDHIQRHHPSCLTGIVSSQVLEVLLQGRLAMPRNPMIMCRVGSSITL